MLQSKSTSRSRTQLTRTLFASIACWLAFCPLTAQTKAPAGAKDPKGKAGATKPGDSKKSARDVAAERALLRQTEKVEAAHLKALEGIVTWASSNGLKEEAEKVLGIMKSIDAEAPSLAKLGPQVDKAPPPRDPAKVPDLKTTFAKKLEEANDKNASRLFDLATACMKLGLFTRAFDLVSTVVEADPDHKRARDILGFAWDTTAKKWVRKYDAEMAKKYFLTDEGWVKKENKKNWDAGKREYQGKWVTKEEEERIRKRNDYNPFFVESEHFRIETNLGRKQAWEFANLLEDFYAQFFRFYLGFYDQTTGQKLLFATARNKKRHRVKVFPSQVEYLTFVKAEKGNQKLLVESAGFWEEGDQCSYFYYADRENTLRTLYHEVTHQLFGETKTSRGSSKGNNWVIEGLASYMETWEKVDGKWLPGHRTGIDRLVGARQFLAANPGFNLASFLAIDNEQFHKENRGLNYAMSAAFCHFLMHGEGEIYREPFIQFVSAFYDGKVVEDSLGRYIQVEKAETPAGVIQVLEGQFKSYMANLGEKGPTAAPTEKTQEGTETK